MRAPRYVHDTRVHNRQAAQEVVPWVMRRLAPRTVIDVGCGTGSWLAVFAEHGCEILGLEGESVADELLVIPRARFRVVDLEKEIEPPGRFDFALCLEVAEHLSAPAGRRLVRLLCSASDAILFGAAVPGQGGENHINEQWPDYWQRTFEEEGFSFEDEIRWQFWRNERVEWWYRQNMFIARRTGGTTERALSVVHPGLLDKKARAIEDFYQGRLPLRTAAIVALRGFLAAVRRR